MKKLLFLLLALTVSAPAFAQTQTQYYTVPTIAALKAMTTSRPAVVQVVDANPGIFNLSAGACAAADDVFQVQPTGGTTVCYTRMASTAALGKTAPLYVQSYGAVCDGTTDDRVAIQAAITATPFGGSLFFPPTQCASSAANATYMLTASQPMSFIFAQGGGIKPLASVPSTSTVLHLYGHASNFAQTVIDGMFIGDNNSGVRYGGVGIIFDTTAVGPKYFNRAVVRNTMIMANAAGDYAIRVVNDQTNNPDGGTSRTIFGPGNFLFGGIDLEKAGDSIGLVSSLIQGSQTPSVRVNLVQGVFGMAGNFYMIGMNVGYGGGGVVISCAQSFQITSSEFEQGIASTNPNNTQIDVRGDECEIGQGVITGNQIQNNAAIGSPTSIRVDNTVGVVIDNNKISVPIDYTPVIVGSSAIGTVIGAGNTYVNTTTPVSDSSATTVYTLIRNGNIGNATGTNLTLSGSAATLSVANSGTTPNPFYATSGQTGTTRGSNVVGRLASLATGRDVNLQLSDTITNSTNVGMVGGTFYIRTNGVDVLGLSSAGALTFPDALTYGGVTLSNSVTGTGSMVLSASPTFTGTVNAAAITTSGAISAGTSVNAAAASGYLLGGVSFALTSGDYTLIKDGEANSALQLGDSTDPKNYHWNTSHVFGSRNTAVTFATLNSTGLSLTGTLTAVIASTAQTNVACYNSTSGLFTYQTAASGCAVSSARFKENITVKSNADALKVVTSLEPVKFQYKASAGMDRNWHDGFIAEQVAKVAPDLVEFDADGKTPRAVKYQELAPYFAGAIRELKAANDNLKAEIAELKKKVK